MGGAVVDTGLFDWATFDNILPAYRKGPPASWGLLQIRKKGLRDLGATLRAEVRFTAHPPPAPRRWALRIPRVCDNALQMARWLEAQPAVRSVNYPGLASHAQHERAAKLFHGGFGPLLSFELRRDGIDCFAFLDALQLVIDVQPPGRQPHAGEFPVAHTIFHEMGAERRCTEMGIADQA